MTPKTWFYFIDGLVVFFISLFFFIISGSRLFAAVISVIAISHLFLLYESRAKYHIFIQISLGIMFLVTILLLDAETSGGLGPVIGIAVVDMLFTLPFVAFYLAAIAATIFSRSRG